MVKKIKGDLILTEDTTFNESIEVEGNIVCKEMRYNLKVAGNIVAMDINAWNIDAGDINAWYINAGNINAGNIDAGNIVAMDINAWNIDAGNIIFCEDIKIKDKSKGKIKAKAVIRKRFELDRKEWDSD